MEAFLTVTWWLGCTKDSKAKKNQSLQMTVHFGRMIYGSATFETDGQGPGTTVLLQYLEQVQSSHQTPHTHTYLHKKEILLPPLSLGMSYGESN